MAAKFVVFGANGYIGSNFFSQRSVSGSQLISVTRHASDVHENATGHCTLNNVLASINAKELFNDAIVLHFIGKGREESENAMYRGNVEITEGIISLCRTYGAKKIIYLSGFGVSKKTSSAYYRCKAICEDLIINSDIDYTILRLSYVVGRGDELTPVIRSAAATGTVVIPGNGSFRIQPVWIDDVTEIIGALALSDRYSHTVIELLGEAVTYRRFVGDVVKTIDKNIGVVEREAWRYFKAAVTEADPDLSVDELAILFADVVGPVVPQFENTRLKSYSEIVEALGGNQCNH